MNDYDEFKIWYTQKAPDESEVTMVDMAAMAWHAARAASPAMPYQADEIPRLVECLKKANENAEHFERQYYLLLDKVEELEARAASPKVPQSDLEIRCKVLTALLEEHVLLDHLDWDEDDWCRRAELALGPELGGVFNEMFEAKNKALPQGAEEWIAEHGLQYVDTLGGYGVKLKRSSELKYPCPEYVSVDDLSELLSGMAIVPVVGKDSFVQLVPDHCDRIVWRGSYHHLPLAATKEKGE